MWPPATRNAGTIAHAETREASTSFSVAAESGGPGDGASSDVASLQVENAALKAKVTELTAQVTRLKSELAVQTAKALESDEWVAKLATDKEGSAAKEAVKLSAKLHEHSSPKAGERKSPKSGERKKSPKSDNSREVRVSVDKAERHHEQEQEQQSGGESGLSEGSPRKEHRQSKMAMFLNSVSSTDEDA
jgi:hypothetical protein